MEPDAAGEPTAPVTELPLAHEMPVAAVTPTPTLASATEVQRLDVAAMHENCIVYCCWGGLWPAWPYCVLHVLYCILY